MVDGLLRMVYTSIWFEHAPGEFRDIWKHRAEVWTSVNTRLSLVGLYSTPKFPGNVVRMIGDLEADVPVSTNPFNP